VTKDRRTPWIENWQASASPRFPGGQCGDHEIWGVSRNAPRRGVRNRAEISFAGYLELYRSSGFVRTTGEKLMSDDPDFPKVNHALQVLRQARFSRNEAAAIMLADLVYEMAGTGLRTPEIEEARQAAWDAISALAKLLKEEGFAPPSLWKAAFGATETWIDLLD
jgi:hypothetical protein